MWNRQTSETWFHNSRAVFELEIFCKLNNSGSRANWLDHFCLLLLSSHARKDVVTITCQFLTFPGSLTIVTTRELTIVILRVAAERRESDCGIKPGNKSCWTSWSITIVQTRGREFMFHGENKRHAIFADPRQNT